MSAKHLLPQGRDLDMLVREIEGPPKEAIGESSSP